MFSRPQRDLQIHEPCPSGSLSSQHPWCSTNIQREIRPRILCSSSSPQVLNTVGLLNYKAFLLFLLYTMLAAAVAAGASFVLPEQAFSPSG